MRFEIFQGKAPKMGNVTYQVRKDGGLVLEGHWYFRIRSANGQIVAQSEAYSRKSDANRATKALERAFNGRIIPVKVIE